MKPLASICQKIMSAARRNRRKVRLFLRTIWRVALGLFVLALAAGLAVIWLVMRGQIDAPDWVRTRMETAIANAVPDGRLAFDDLQLRLDGSGLPRVQMRNAVLLGADDTPLIEVANMRADLSLSALLTGNVLPESLSIEGVFLDVVRAPDGTLSVDFSAADADGLFSGRAFADGVLSILNRPALARLDKIEVDAVTLRYVDQRATRSWTVDGGRARIALSAATASVSADFALLSGRASVATLQANADVNRQSGALQFGVSVTDLPAADLATQQAALAWLAVLDAPISGSIRGGVDPDGGLLPFSAALKIGAGSVRPNDVTQAVPFRAAGSYFTFDPATQMLRFDEISVDSDWLIGRTEGTAQMLVGPDGFPTGFDAQFTFSELGAAENGLWETGVKFQNADVSFGLQLAPFALDIRNATLAYQDAKLTASGQILGSDEGWSMALDASIPTLQQDQLATLWPVGQAENARRWVIENVENAIYTDADLRLSAPPGQKARFEFDTDVVGATIRYAPMMTPGHDVAGHIALKDKRLVATVSAGRVAPFETGGIDMAGTVYSVADVTDKAGQTKVQLQGSGDLTSVMAVLEQIPQLAQDDVDLVNLATGQAVFSGILSFPSGRKPLPEDYKYSIFGQVTDVSSDSLLRGQVVTAPNLIVSASNTQVTVQGPAQIGGVEINAKWVNAGAEGGAGSALTGQIELSQKFVEQFGLGLPPGMVSGTGTGTLVVDLPKGQDPIFELRSDLSGIGLDLGFVGYQKAPKTKGSLIAKGRLGNPVSIDELSLSAPGFLARGTVRLEDDGSLKDVVFREMKIKDWLDGSLRIKGNGAGVAPDIYLTGGRVDVQALTRATGGIGAKGVGKKVQGRLYTTLDQLFVSDFLSLENLSGEFDLANNMRGNFAGRLNEAVDVTGTIASDAKGRRVITVSSDDAGKVFSALGLLDRASQGNILVELTEKTEGYGGRFLARDLRLLDMPLFADLLNAISVVGLLDQLSFDGIAFGEVEGDFYFSEDKFILTRASATGPSIGLSLDGTYDFVRDQLDLQGTLTPVFLVNGIGGLLNRKGEGLIGFTFNVKGPAQSPQISVNPFSALAPSLFRDIFRKPAPTAPE